MEIKVDELHSGIFSPLDPRCSQMFRKSDESLSTIISFPPE